MPYKANLLFHVRSLRNCLSRFDAKAQLDIETMELEVSGRGKCFRLKPQFLMRNNNRLMYTPILHADVRGFIGWLPYVHKRWELARDKLVFKQYCDRHNIRTPKLWTKADDSIQDVLIKERVSSFGYGIRGPFRLLPSNIEPRAETAQVIYEQFIWGNIAKAWYCEDKFVCLEVLSMPTATGDEGVKKFV